jgi:L-iditol 2-dehydrogenase
MSGNSADSLQMRVSVLRQPGVIAVEERPVPVPAPDEVLVQVGSVGVCGSDVHYYRHGRIAHHVVKRPLILGHEAGGRIVSVGPGVDPARVGERVALEPGVPCRRCRECKSGRYNLCRDVRFFATPPIDGAFAQYVTIAADFAHPIPATISDDGAGLIEPLAVAVWGCGKVGVGPGSSVLISGAGPIGLMHAQVARAMGATAIVVSDVAAARRDVAAGYGATRVLDPVAEDPVALGIEVDAYLDCSGAPSAIQQGVRTVRPAGQVALVGMGADEISLPVGLIQNRELTITGTFRYANAYPTAISLAASGLVDLDRMVTAHVTLDEVEQGLGRATDPESIKVVVRPGD